MKKELYGALVWAGLIFALALGSVFARKQGLIDDDTVKRIVIGANGLMIAWYGNRLPKAVVRNAEARKAQRVSAWSQVLSGLTYAGLWAFAPIPTAIVWGTFAVVAGIVVTLGYCLTLRGGAKAS